MARSKPLSNNAGLTVRLNLWSMEKKIGDFDAERARLFISGQVKNELTGDVKKFRDAGQLVTTLGKWNAEQLKRLRERKA